MIFPNISFLEHYLWKEYHKFILKNNLLKEPHLKIFQFNENSSENEIWFAMPLLTIFVCSVKWIVFYIFVSDSLIPSHLLALPFPPPAGDWRDLREVAAGCPPPLLILCRFQGWPWHSKICEKNQESRSWHLSNKHLIFFLSSCKFSLHVSFLYRQMTS